MAKKLSIITNGMNGGLPVQNQGLKLSKIIAVEKIEEHERFRELYSIDEDLLSRITEDMKSNKFDESQPVHIWLASEDGEEHFYLIDGYTRVRAAKSAGLLTVPYFEHHFDSFEEAHRYALHLQVDRRNLSGMDLLRNIEELMGSDYIKSMSGNKNAAVGELLGVSEKTVERANFVERNATDEQKAEIKSGETTINATYNDIKESQFVEKHASAEQKERIESGEATVEDIYAEIKNAQNQKKSDRHETSDNGSDMDSFDDISDALEDNSDQPKGLVISDHSDHIERPTNRLSAEEDSERTRERHQAFELGYADGFVKAADYIFAEFFNGTAMKSIYEKIFCERKPDYELYNHYRPDNWNPEFPTELTAYDDFRRQFPTDYNPRPLSLSEDTASEKSAESDNSESEENGDSDSAFDIEFEE